MLSLRRGVVAWICLVLLPSFAQAGGPYIVTESGTPSLWDNSGAITVHPESGSCATYSSDEMVAVIEDVLSTWTELTEVSLSFSVSEGELDDVDSTNYTDYFSASGDVDQDDLSPIIFDDDGEITAAVAGEANRYAVLGFASASVFSSDGSEILEGQAVINCRCLEGNPEGECEDEEAGTVVFPISTMNFTILHEMGHFLNLDHTQVNIELYSDTDNTEYEDLPVMFPYIVSPDEQITPHWDDIAALATLYPADAFAEETCIVTGDLLDASGNDLRCADVWAEDGDLADTTAFVSGTTATASDSNNDADTVDDGECTANCGHFELHLRTGMDYTISVKSIFSDFTSGSGMGPCYLDQSSTITDEEVASVSAAQCTAGSTIDLGSITTTSTSSTGSSGGNSEVDDGDPITIGGESSSVTNPDGWWCSLNANSQNSRIDSASSFGLIFVIFITAGILAIHRIRPN